MRLQLSSDCKNENLATKLPTGVRNLWTKAAFMHDISEAIYIYKNKNNIGPPLLPCPAFAFVRNQQVLKLLLDVISKYQTRFSRSE